MNSPRHSPYDGTSTPFTIGLKALDPDRWIETDGDLEAYLAEKDRLLEADRSVVFQEMEGSRPAQREILDLITGHLLTRHGKIYQEQGSSIAFLNRTVERDGTTPPLITAGSLIADDLALLENRDGAWRVTAGYIAFPSSWSLKEKAGLTIGEIHGPVPGFQAGTRNDELINRMFDKLQPGRLVERFNWSIYPDETLHWPPEKAARAATQPFLPAANVIRVERQTLCRLPKTGGIVFTIRIYRDPLAILEARPELARQMKQQLQEMTQEQLAYKGLDLRKKDLDDLLTRYSL
jgi:dimethylamine monooxygenase subunit A